MKTTTLPLRNLRNRSPLRFGFLLIPLTLAWLALSSTAQAVCQQGCNPNDKTVLGDDALVANTTGYDNTAIGFQALHSNTTGFFNTAHGFGALASNTTGVDNTANGSYALYSNAGDFNTANGFEALYSNTIGFDNTANGAFSLEFNTTGHDNTANGGSALLHNTTGNNNTASGSAALLNNTTGIDNTANGGSALYSNTTGSNNTADGFDALQNNTGSNNIAVGYQAGINLTTGSNNIDIGALGGAAGESRKIRIGKPGTQNGTFIAGISGATAPTGVAVIVDGSGHLGTTTSSARYKDAIKPMDKASEAILALQPVTFRYKHELDPNGIPQFGLVAEQVEKVNPDLVARDDQGKPYTVRYEAVNAMLVNEFIKEHRKVEQQATTIAQQRKHFQASITKLEATVAQQQKGMEVLTASLKAQAAQMQKVTRLRRVEVSKPSPQMVVNNQ
jgi:hypothetical protein